MFDISHEKNERSPNYRQLVNPSKVKPDTEPISLSPRASGERGVLIALASPWHKLPGGKLYSKSPQE